MHEYLFDGRLAFAIRVKAEGARAAKAKIVEALDCATVSVEIDGETVAFEVSVDYGDDGPDLTVAEIDGEAV